MKKYIVFLLALTGASTKLVQADGRFGVDFVRRYGANSPIMSTTSDYFQCKPKRIAHERTCNTNRRRRRTKNHTTPQAGYTETEHKKMNRGNKRIRTKN